MSNIFAQFLFTIRLNFILNKLELWLDYFRLLYVLYFLLFYFWLLNHCYFTYLLEGLHFYLNSLL